MSDATHTTTPEDELGFDQVIEHLQQVVSRLESGNLSLEESLQAYERGVALARRGHSLLDSAEKRVELLVRSSGGEVVTEPMPSESPESEEL